METAEDKMLQSFQPGFHYSRPSDSFAHTGILCVSFCCFINKSLLWPTKIAIIF